jgi:diacylglycerol diphosphate phosphatase / phosphatidate phosphatase
MSSLWQSWAAQLRGSVNPSRNRVLTLFEHLANPSWQIYKAPLAAVRTFPIIFDTSGDIVYPDFAFPSRGWIISPTMSAILSAVIPICIILIAQIRIRSFWDANNAILGLLYSLILSTLFQVVIKQLIGGFRPYFLEVCAPDLSRAASHNTTGLNGVGYHQIMYSVDVCTNTNEDELKNAMTSFPSGHSTAAFAGYIFLFLWMNAKLKVWGNYQTSFWALGLLFAPLLGATLIACSLTIDQAHNWYDILVGAIIGTCCAFASYRICFAAVFDWRFNHLPLTRGKLFDYTVAFGTVPEYTERALFVRKLGWGRRRRVGTAAGKRHANGIGSARSSATYARAGGTGLSPERSAVRYPETTRKHQRSTADDMV